MGQAATVAKAARAEPSRRLGVVPSWGTAKLESMTVMVRAILVKTGVRVDTSWHWNTSAEEARIWVPDAPMWRRRAKRDGRIQTRARHSD